MLVHIVGHGYVCVQKLILLLLTPTIATVVISSTVLAAMLAVVPALGTYWACLPAVLDLWLAQGKKFHAITLAVCQFLPTLFVDATIYTEINE